MTSESRSRVHTTKLVSLVWRHTSHFQPPQSNMVSWNVQHREVFFLVTFTSALFVLSNLLSVNQSISQSINKSINQSIIHQPSLNESMNQLINHQSTINPLINESLVTHSLIINESMNQSINESINQLINQSINQIFHFNSGAAGLLWIEEGAKISEYGQSKSNCDANQNFNDSH